MKRVLLAGIAFFCALEVAADSPAISGRPYNVTPLSPENVVIFHLTTTSARTGYPACVNSFPNRFAFPANTDAGKAMLATVLTAYAKGDQVIVEGTGACSLYVDAETVHWVATSEP